MKRIAPALILSLLFAVNIFAGGPACVKVILDSYGVLGAEASAAYEGGFSPMLTQEASALTYTSHAFCDGFMELYPAIQWNDADLKAGLALSYAECDWAKEMRVRRDQINAMPNGQAKTTAANALAMSCRGWRDQLSKWMQDTAAKYIGSEYLPAGSTSSSSSARVQ